MAKLQSIEHPLATAQGVEIWLLHEAPGRLSGNKFYKLRDNLAAARAQRKSMVVSFGGAWSNHIVALAHAARGAGLGSLGLIRGEAAYAGNASLTDAQLAGMQLRFLSREQYRQRNNSSYLHQLQNDYPAAMILPEGGSNLSAVKSCADMLRTVEPEFLQSMDVVAAAVGTGATLTGLRSALFAGQQARGYYVVRDPDRQNRMEHWWQQLSTGHTETMPEKAGLHLVDAIAPGYAKLDAAHWQWVRWLAENYGIWLDPLYTVKMLTMVFHELEGGQFKRGTRLLLVHTGGWQGWRGQVERAGAHYELVNTINQQYADALQEHR